MKILGICGILKTANLRLQLLTARIPQPFASFMNCSNTSHFKTEDILVRTSEKL
jgi:hypothetical protein